MEEENNSTGADFVEGNAEIERTEPAYNEDEMSMEGGEN